MANGESEVKLVGLSGPYRGNEYFLDDSEFFIGRSSDNNLVLNETTVSGKHAKIVKAEDAYSIYDLNSTNGTFVNGVKIDKKTLRTNDVVQFDIIEFRYINKKEVARTAVSDQPAYREAKTEVKPQASAAKGKEPELKTVPSPEEAVPAAAEDQGKGAKPVIKPSPKFETSGHLFIGLIVGLLIAALIGFGGSFVALWSGTNFSMDPVAGLNTTALTFPFFHLHTSWVNATWNLQQIITLICVVLGLLLGAIVTQSMGRKNRFGTALLFSFLYVLIFSVVQLGAMNFNFQQLQQLMVMSGLGITDATLAMVVVYAYFFGVSFVLSFIGSLFGRK